MILLSVSANDRRRQQCHYRCQSPVMIQCRCIHGTHSAPITGLLRTRVSVYVCVCVGWLDERSSRQREKKKEEGMSSGKGTDAETEETLTLSLRTHEKRINRSWACEWWVVSVLHLRIGDVCSHTKPFLSVRLSVAHNRTSRIIR